MSTTVTQCTCHKEGNYYCTTHQQYHHDRCAVHASLHKGEAAEPDYGSPHRENEQSKADADHDSRACTA